VANRAGPHLISAESLWCWADGRHGQRRAGPPCSLSAPMAWWSLALGPYIRVSIGWWILVECWWGGVRPWYCLLHRLRRIDTVSPFTGTSERGLCALTAAAPSPSHTALATGASELSPWAVKTSRHGCGWSCRHERGRVELEWRTEGPRSVWSEEDIHLPILL
jgi:hypothetical protein